MTFDCPIRVWAQRTPHALALGFGSRRWTYREIDGDVSRAVSVLTRHGIGAGDRVMIQSKNRPEIVILFHALARLSATLVPLNPRLTAFETKRVCDRIHPKMILTEAELDSLCDGPASSLPARVDENARAVVLLTSGTAGTPKVVELSHSNFRNAARVNAKNLGSDPSQCWLGTLPLFHVGGLALIHRVAEYGASVMLEPDFDADRSLALMREAITHASVVPTMLHRMIHGAASAPLQSMQAILVGGGPVSPELMIQSRSAGLPVLQTYGLTEACSQVATESLETADGQSAGHPLFGIQVDIVDQNGRRCEQGEVGGIEISGSQLGKVDGIDYGLLGLRYATGDIGLLDAQNRLVVLSRRTDLIIRGGENIYPAEVEAVLSMHPAVREIAVVPVDDEHFGQVPVGVVVANESLSEIDLPAWAASRLAPFKVPKKFIQVDALPRNAMGKVEHQKLRALTSGAGSAMLLE